MASRERVIMLIAVDYRSTNALCQLNNLIKSITHYHTATRNNDWELCGFKHFNSFFERVLTAIAQLDALWLWNLTRDLTVEVVTRNVELSGAHIRNSTIKTTCCEFSHTGG